MAFPTTTPKNVDASYTARATPPADEIGVRRFVREKNHLKLYFPGSTILAPLLQSPSHRRSANEDPAAVSFIHKL